MQGTENKYEIGTEVENLPGFFFDEYPVHVLIDNERRYWWLAKEVCNSIGLKNVGQALASLDEDEKGTLESNIIISDVVDPHGLLHRFGFNPVDANKGGRPHAIINEPGLYNLTLRSRKPEAKKFKRWVTHELLPTLRKTGSYAVPGYESITSAQAAEAMNELLGIDPKRERAIARHAVSSYKSLVRSARHLDAAVYDRLIEYYDKHLSYKDIATLLGTSESSVKRWVDWLVAAGLVDRREK
jgi:prophage antirepressor-like protein